MSQGNWILERSSGFSGVRCTKCATWVRLAEERKCDCDRPATQKFVHYLHGEGNLREYMEDAGIELSEQAWENIGRPFYEIGLNCEVDLKGNVRILGIKQD